MTRETNTLLESVLNLIEDLKSLMKDVQKIKSLTKKTNEMPPLSEKVGDLSNENKKLERKIVIIKQKNENLKFKIEDFEQ